MSLTNAEASAVNTLIERLTGRSSCPWASGREMPSDEDLVDAVALLAGHAHRRLMVGFSAEGAVQAVRELLADRAARAVQDGRDEVLVEFERQAARAIACRLDGDELIIDGDEWISDGTDGDGDVLELTHQSGRQVTARVAVEVIEGTLS